MAQGRFSKTAMLEHLHSRVSVLSKIHGFTDRCGWAQVDGKSTETIVAYGQFAACNDLIAEINAGEIA